MSCDLSSESALLTTVHPDPFNLIPIVDFEDGKMNVCEYSPVLSECATTAKRK